MSDSKIEELRKRIVAQANAMQDGWFEMPVSTSLRASGFLRVPKAPFELWAVAQSNGSHLVAPWTAVSPVGVKQGADDPFHTDWMLGAGLDPQDMRDADANPFKEELSSAAYMARTAVEKRLLGFKASILLQGPTVVGRVHLPVSYEDMPPEMDEDGLPPISVFKDAGPDWLAVAVATLNLGGAVVVERGGTVTHLVSVLRESNAGPILRVEKARKIYPQGSLLKIEPASGSVKLLFDSRLGAGLAEQTSNAAPWISDGDDRPEPEILPTLPSMGDLVGSKYGIVRERKGRPSPTDKLDQFIPFGKFNFERFDIYVSLCKASIRAAKSTLQLVVHPKEPSGPARQMQSFHSDHREWTSEEIGKAGRELRDFLDPGFGDRVVARWEATEARKAQERADAKWNWASMSEERIVAFLTDIGEEELDLYHEYYTNEEIGFDEFHERDAQYRTAFSVMREILSERGSDVDVDDYRPVEAERRDIRRRIEARQELHDHGRNAVGMIR